MFLYMFLSLIQPSNYNNLYMFLYMFLTEQPKKMVSLTKPCSLLLLLSEKASWSTGQCWHVALCWVSQSAWFPQDFSMFLAAE